jgi:circadian clock protein KaiB
MNRRLYADTAESRGLDYQMMLFVAGDEHNSMIARKNLQDLCEREIQGRFSLKIVDVLEDFDLAIEFGILVTPTLLVNKPKPPVTIIGNLSDLRKIRAALRIGDYWDHDRGN